jgi:hypothetical protein
MSVRPLLFEQLDNAWKKFNYQKLLHIGEFLQKYLDKIHF